MQGQQVGHDQAMDRLGGSGPMIHSSRAMTRLAPRVDRRQVMSRFLVALVTLALAADATAQSTTYELGADSRRHAGVPQGEVIQQRWEHSAAYPDTERDWWIYVPAQYDGRTPAALMVFQDGGIYVRENGPIRVPVVFDNLIHAGAMPMTIGVFVDPGRFAGDDPQDRARSRSREYDTVSDRYARFLLGEIIPEVRKTYRVTDDPDGWAIAGLSSGGICAFTVAWQRPDRFRKVVSHIGSFTNIWGGHVYPSLIRSSAPRPIRVFLQDGTADLDNRYGNWWLSNQQMAKALAFREYDVETAWGDGGHNLEHGGSIFPDTLRWLWRDYEAPQRSSERNQDR